jgi:hypothetical protein
MMEIKLSMMAAAAAAALIKPRGVYRESNYRSFDSVDGY